MASTEIRMIDPVLTSIAQSYGNSSFVADRLFPKISINKTKGKIPVFGKEAFIHRETFRATRASSNRIPTDEISYIEFEMKERDVEVSLDYLEEEQTPDFLQYEQQITRQLVDILLLGREKEIADYSQNPNNYLSGMAMEITAANAFDDYTKNIDPIVKIREGMSIIRQHIGRYPNVMIIGDSTYRALINHPKVLDKIKYSGLGKGDINMLAQLTEIPNVYIGMSVLSVDSNVFTDVWGDNIVLAYTDENESGRSRIGVSHGYLLQKNGFPEVDTYYENGGKIKVVRATDNFTFVVTTPEASFLIYNTNHLS